MGKTLKWILIVLLIFVLIFLIYFITAVVKNTELSATKYETTHSYPVYPTPNLQGKTPQQVAQIKQGAYLVTAGDCLACHTDSLRNKPSFAGGLPMQTPFGVIYTPNITPDKETGIGNWTEADFIKAMHHGIAPDGSYYYPAFPYIYFNKISINDLKAIKAYLDNIPAVNQKNLKNEMIFPFNWRFIQLGWRLLFFHPTGEFKPDPKQSLQWNRGAYLVEGLGHCSMCHTPSYYIFSPNLSLGAPRQAYNLTGATVQGYLAPNITKSALGAIPDNDLLDVFTKSHMVGGALVHGPMLEAVHDSLMHLSKPDLQSIVTYLKSVQSVQPRVVSGQKNGVGFAIYNSYCSGCHNIGVGGAPRVGDKAGWELLAKSGMDKLYRVAIQGGGGMPAKGTCLQCSDSDIKNAVDYMVYASLNEEKLPVKTKDSTIQRGKQVYLTNCSVCHSNPNNKTAPQLNNKPAWDLIATKGFLPLYSTVQAGKNNHPVKGGCTNCTDADLIDAIKYMLMQNDINEYIFW